MDNSSRLVASELIEPIVIISESIQTAHQILLHGEY